MEVFWDDDTLWTDPVATWTGTVDIVAVLAPARPNVAFASSIDRLRRNQPKKYRDKLKDVKITPKPEPEPEPKYIRLTCAVDDEFFDKKNFINQKLSVDFLGGEYIVTEASPSGVSRNEAEYVLERLNKETIKIKVRDIKVSLLIYENPNT